MIITYKQIREGDLLPSWYYGLAYKDFARATWIFYPIPINYIVRLGKIIKHFWNRWRSKPTWLDRQVTAGINEHIKKFDDRVDRHIQEATFLPVKEKKDSLPRKMFHAIHDP